MTAPWRDFEQGSPVLRLRIPLYVLDALRCRAAERGVSPLTVACELLKAAVEDDVP